MAWEERLHFVFSFSIVVCFYCDWFPMFFVYAFVGVTKNSCCWNVHNASQCIIAQHKAPEGLNRFPLRLFQWKSLVSSCFSLWTFHAPAISVRETGCQVIRQNRAKVPMGQKVGALGHFSHLCQELAGRMQGKQKVQGMWRWHHRRNKNSYK